MRPARRLKACLSHRGANRVLAIGLLVLLGLAVPGLSASNRALKMMANPPQGEPVSGSPAEKFNEVDLENLNPAFSAAQGDENRATRVARNIELVGAYDARPDGGGLLLGAYKKLAFVLAARGSVSIIDISDPRLPIKVGATPEIPPFSSETANAVRIGSRDILAISYTGISRTGASLVTAPFRLFDITDPATPKEVGSFDPGLGILGDAIQSGSFTFEIVQLRGNRTVALLTPAGAEYHGYLRTTGARLPDGSLLSDRPLPASLQGKCRNLCGDLLLVDT